jgi:hypothetical protein
MRKIILLLSVLPVLGLFAAFSIHSAPAGLTNARRTDAFQEFLKQFDKKSLPYAISTRQLQKQLESDDSGALKKTASGTKMRLRLDDPEGFIPFNRREMISRVPVSHQPVAHLATADHHAVVYTSFRGYSRQYKTYNIVVFDKAGNLISSNLLAQTTREYITAATVDAELRATIQTYQINREKEDSSDSKITGLTLESSEKIDLTTPTETDEDIIPKPVKKAEPELPRTESLGVARH